MHFQGGHPGFQPGKLSHPVQTRISTLPKRISTRRARTPVQARIRTLPKRISTGATRTARTAAQHGTARTPGAARIREQHGNELSERRPNGLHRLPHCPAIHTHSIPAGTDIFSARLRLPVRKRKCTTAARPAVDRFALCLYSSGCAGMHAS
jgi:hypothetical protein